MTICFLLDHFTTMEELKNSLTCCICMEVATLPVHSLCCESAKSMPPACMTCVRSYLGLNQPFNSRPYSKKSWSGCGCNINTRQNARGIYSHTVQLDTIRNLIGPSICPHEECKAECITSAELRRHLGGTAKDSDKASNCQYAMTRCKHCDLFGVRHFIEGEHYNTVHNTVFCPLCDRDIAMPDLRDHYFKHITYLETFRKNIMDKHISLEE